ncbi:MAG: integrin alpha, partial [Candidatus Margulisiibacteriota bacterium]
GCSVSTAGDVNGDSRSDFIVGAYFADPGGLSAAGTAYVYSGATGTVLYTLNGAAAGDNFGASVSTAGDVNGDGKSDFIVGADLTDPAGVGTNAGTAYVYSGATGTLLYSRNGAAAGDNFGHSVSTAGDVNGDGKSDFIVGAYFAIPVGVGAEAGSAYVYLAR